MSIRMQRDIDELRERVKKLESVVVRLIARLDTPEIEQEQEPKRKPGRPKKQDEAHA